jgi:hypothetical protein
MDGNDPHHDSGKEVKIMRKLNHLLAFILVVGLLLTSVHIISAQQRGGQGRPPQMQGRQMDPEAMVNRMMERIMGRLNLSAEESAALKPRIEGILRMQIEQNREVRQLVDDLEKAIDANKQIEDKLKAVKDKRKEHKANAEKKEKELVELLTIKQEAQLTVDGVVNSDGSGFRFGGFGGPGQRNRPGGQGR